MDQYIVSARKYRPRKFSEVVGQEHVTDTLKNALKSGHLAHAFLFCGPRGVGKTTCARILGKALNCLQPTEDFEPCNECEMCAAMNRNASFNIIEQDGASNNKVDDIRDLIGHVVSPPPRGKYKVFIIDEVHMLTQQAFNAFLKTLEEPPAHAIFILATTEKHKILPTILSRCQIYDFRRLEVDDMKHHLQYICTEEGIQAEEDALHLIAQKADGALRDSLSLFDRIASATNGEISYNAVVENLNILDFDAFFQLTDLILKQDIGGTLSTFQSILRKGFEPGQVINGLAQHFRDLLVCQTKANLSLLEMSESVKQRYQRQADAVPMQFLLGALDVCNACDTHYIRAKNKRLHVELALCKLNYLTRVETLGLRAESNEKKKTDPGIATAAPNPPSSSDSSTQASPPDSEQNSSTPKSAPPEQPSPEPPKENTAPKEASEASSERATDPTTEPPPPKKVRKKLNRKGPARFKTPDIGGGLDQYEKKVEETKQQREKNRNELSQENVEAFFENLAATANPASLRVVLKTVKVRVQNDALQITVKSEVDKTTLLQETWVIQALRDHFMQSKLQVSFEVDQAHEENDSPPDRPVSKKEVFDLFTKENPDLRDLQQRFQLRFDK